VALKDYTEVLKGTVVSLEKLNKILDQSPLESKSMQGLRKQVEQNESRIKR
jgi:hypothetical protein